MSLKRFRATSDEAARGWVFGIARNLVRRHHRRGRLELATCRKLGIELDHDPDELAQLESRLEAAAQAGKLTHALDTLPDAQRQALQLRVIDELDYGEAAALMGTSEQNPRIRVSRALKPSRCDCQESSDDRSRTAAHPPRSHRPSARRTRPLKRSRSPATSSSCTPQCHRPRTSTTHPPTTGTPTCPSPSNRPTRVAGPTSPCGARHG